MAAGLKGAFTVTAHRAEQLKDTATFGKQDPFCKLTIGSSTQKTKVHKDGGTAPVWEQAFTFNLEGKEDVLHVACAEDGTLSDSDIGRADISLTTLLQHAGRKKYPLVDRNNFKINAGYIELTCEFKGTGAPAILSKSAEVLAQEKHQAAIQAGAQAVEIEKMRLEVEKMKLEAQAEAARAAQAAAMIRQMQQAAQPVYIPPPQPIVTGQTPVVQPVVVQQPKVEVKQEVKVEVNPVTSHILSAAVVLYEANWRYCQKCQCLYKGTSGKNTPPCPAGSVHDGDSDQTTNYQFACGATKPQSQCQDGWILCDKCTCMCYGNNAKCIKGGPHNSNGQKYYAHLVGHTSHHQNQWNFCKKCYQLVYGPQAATSACAAGGNHDVAGSWNYVVAHGAEVKQVNYCAYQGLWRYCQKCQLLYYGPNGTPTPACAAGGVHDGHHEKTSNYFVGFGDPKPSEGHQEGWTFCQKCWCMCYGSNGACVRGGPHDTSTSWKYVMHRVPHFTACQKGWNFCKKCYSLVWGERAKGGACAAGGNHDNTGSWEYVVAYK